MKEEIKEIKKAWFKIKEDVEYSTDFNLFLENQARLVKCGRKYTFCSRLESKTFRVNSAILSLEHEFSDTEVINMWKEIHKEILASKHGEGEFVN